MYIIRSEDDSVQIQNVRVVITVSYEDGAENSTVIAELGVGVTQVNLADLEIDGYIGEKRRARKKPAH